MLIQLLAIYGLAFLLKESAGPFDIMDWLRNALMRNKHVGVFFYKLFACYFCVGCHCGWIVYLLSANVYSWPFFVLWTLAGGVVSIMLDAIMSRLRSE